MTSEATGSSQIDAPASMANNFQPQEYFCCKDIVSPKSAFIIKQVIQTDLQEIHFPESCCFPLNGKPPGGKNKKKLIQRSASSDAILSNYLSGEWLNPNFQSVIKPQSSLCTKTTSTRNLPPTPKSASPGLMTKSHLNLWPVTSLFKKTFRSSFKKLCQGSMEGLNQELEKLTLTSEDIQSVPDGHRAPIQELLDMFCDSPPTSTPPHLPLLLTLSSSSSSPPPPSISSASSQIRHSQSDPHPPPPPHHHHRQQQPISSSAWSPRESPEVPTTFNLGSEVRQVKPIRCAVIGEEGFEMNMRGNKARESPKLREYVPPSTSSRSSSSSSLLSCSLPHGPLLSPVAMRANIPSNQSAFASYPTLPKSFKVKDTLRVIEGFGVVAAASVGQS